MAFIDKECAGNRTKKGLKSVACRIDYGFLCFWKKVKVLGTQFCPTLCDPMDYSQPGSTVHRILQAKILEWVAMPFARGSS